MFTNWIPGISKHSQKVLSPSQYFSQQQIRFFLQKIEQHLSQQLGERIEPQLSQSQRLVDSLTNSLTNRTQSNKSVHQQNINQSSMEAQLLATKQKYNNLVNQLDNHNQSMKDILSHIIELLLSIGEIMQSEDLQAPIKQFQSSFQSLNAGKVQKQLRYFLKLFEASLDDYLGTKIKLIEQDHESEISVSKSYAKDIEIMLQKQRNKAADLSNKLEKLLQANSQNIEKIKSFEEKSMEVSIEQYEKQLKKYHRTDAQQNQKIKVLQKECKKQEKYRKEMEAEVSKLNGMLEQMRKNQETIIEELQSQLKKKEKIYQQSMSRSCHQKLLLQQKLSNLSLETKNMKSELKITKKNSCENSQQSSPVKQGEKSMIKDLEERVADLQLLLKNQRAQKKLMVSKEIMKGLFIQFEDQSKEWTIRRDIKNQIELLLGVSVSKAAKKQKNKQSQSKGWFQGFF